jgi:hypothetical protein
MPLAKNPLSPATTALGFAQGPGDQLQLQQKDETEEMKRKRQLGQYSPAMMALLGPQSAFSN